MLFLFAFALIPVCVNAQGYDESGMLTGRYFFRYLHFTGVTDTGTIGRARSISGTITFDGKGSYQASAIISDTSSGGTNGQATQISNPYFLEANGAGAIRDLAESNLDTNISVGKTAIVGIGMDTNVYDLFIAVPAPASSNTSTTQLVNGTYTGGSLDFLSGQAAQARSTSFRLSSNGQGALSSISLSGTALNVGSGVINQTIPSAAYTMDATGSGTVQFGTPAGSAAQSLVSGNKVLYVSADGSTILGGSTSGYDLFVGVKPVTTRTTIDGTFFTADVALDVQSSAPAQFFYGFFGSSRYGATGSVRHRFYHELNDDPFDWTLNGDPLTVSSDGTAEGGPDGVYILGANSGLMIFVGRTSPELFVGTRFRDYTPTGSVYLYPNGILNAANYAPITNPIAPGELINLYGTGFATGTTVSQTLPFPTTLSDVSVTIGGLKSAIYYVSPTQISAIVPYDVDTSQGFLDVSVTKAGTNSNTVYMPASDLSPGVFTLSQNGFGPAAILHSDFSLVNSTKPAKPGETLLLYLTGMGTVTPTVADGAAGPTNPLAATDYGVTIRINGVDSTVTYSGLAPGLAGLYQVNFTVPANTATGTYDVEVATPLTLSFQGTVQVSN